MKKRYKYALNGFWLFGIGNATLNAIRQLATMKEGDTFNWERFAIAFLKGGAFGGGGGFLIGARKDYINKKELPLNTAALLHEAALGIRMQKTDHQYVSLQKKAEWIKQVLYAEYAGKLKMDPFEFGSTEKNTALHEHFDIDICVMFKPRSFSSTQVAADDLYETFKRYEGIHGIENVRKQSKSIGLFFTINDTQRRIDLLPMKATYQDTKKGSGYIHVRGDWFTAGSRMKTDVLMQNKIKISPVQEKLILLVKRWKTEIQLPLSSHLVTYLVLDVYDCNRGEMKGTLANKLIRLLKHIERYIESMRLTTFENSNNVLTDISQADKQHIRQACRKVLDDYEYQPNSLVKHFGDL